MAKVRIKTTRAQKEKKGGPVPISKYAAKKQSIAPKTEREQS